MAFKSIHKDELVKKSWKTVFKVVYNIWLIVVFSRLLLRIYKGVEYKNNGVFDLWLTMSAFCFLLMFLYTFFIGLNPVGSG